MTFEAKNIEGISSQQGAEMVHKNLDSLAKRVNGISGIDDVFQKFLKKQNPQIAH